LHTRRKCEKKSKNRSGISLLTSIVSFLSKMISFISENAAGIIGGTI